MFPHFVYMGFLFLEDQSKRRPRTAHCETLISNLQIRFENHGALMVPDSLNRSIYPKQAIPCLSILILGFYAQAPTF